MEMALEREAYLGPIKPGKSASESSLQVDIDPAKKLRNST